MHRHDHHYRGGMCSASRADQRSPLQKKSPVTKSARDRGISLDGWLFVASSPDMHFFSFFDQFITELRMRDGDQRFRTLPCRETL